MSKLHDGWVVMCGWVRVVVVVEKVVLEEVASR